MPKANTCQHCNTIPCKCALGIPIEPSALHCIKHQWNGKDGECPYCSVIKHNCNKHDSYGPGPCLDCIAETPPLVKTNKAKTETLSPGIEQIPFEALEACGEIFKEGEVKYGKDNWKKGVGDPFYQTERCRHAIRHLYKWANGDRSEPHLAKVMWFCVTQIWTEKQNVPISKTGPAK
jgi:hypothetical protein